MDDLANLGFKNVSYLNGPGVYVLCYKRRVMYVGKTMNGFQRVGLHVNNITFDQVYFVRHDPDGLDTFEKQMIAQLEPSLNLNIYMTGTESRAFGSIFHDNWAEEYTETEKDLREALGISKFPRRF